MYYVSPLPRGVFASQGGWEGRLERRKTKRAGDDGKGKVGKSPHRLFMASQRLSLAYHFLISLFYHVYSNAQQEPLQGSELLCILFTGDYDDALFSEYFFLMVQTVCKTVLRLWLMKNSFEQFLFVIDSESVVNSLCFLCIFIFWDKV